MSSGRKCKNCGSSDIEVDPARGDAVCTNCGSVLEDNIIVAEVQFEENAHGTSSAIGQFVSADSKGGASNFGASFHVGMGVESREVTLKKARNGISNLCNQLRLNQHCIDTACSFFKMALSRNLTRGRRNTHVHAACVYLTCRTEGTAHMLIDISDVLQICCYELGRTYLKLSQALCINVPSLDPCLYILRFAAKLEFGAKTQQVVNTALRLVQRMKRDSIHSGRRPSGLCGAALLMAARLHEFSRSTSDIVKIVKVHESTLRKRLIEFGDTPSSALTLEEFMTVDLEEEQDPPSFKAARKKDKERLQKLMEEEADSITELQKEIEKELDKDKPSRKGKRSQERNDTDKFIEESTIGTINQIINAHEDSMDDPAGVEVAEEPVMGLGPDIASMGLAKSLEDSSNAIRTDQAPDVDLTFDDVNDDELDMYIMSENESERKNGLWHKHNAAYLEEQKIKEERLKKEKEEGKPEKKKKRNVRKRQPIGPSNSAGEAIEKILQEKKISTKINYDVLKSLNAPLPTTENTENAENSVADTAVFHDKCRKRPRVPSLSEDVLNKHAKPTKSRKANKASGLDIFAAPETSKEETKEESTIERLSEDDMEEDYEEENPGVEEPANEMGVMQMLQQHREDDDEAEDYFGTGYEEEDY